MNKLSTTPKASTRDSVPCDDVLARLHAAVRESDPNINPDDEPYKAAVVLLASANVGPNDRKIAKLTKYPLALVQEFGDRLRQSRVWKDGKVWCEWDDPESGGVAFWLDVSIAVGWLKRAR